MRFYLKVSSCALALFFFFGLTVACAASSVSHEHQAGLQKMADSSHGQGSEDTGATFKCACCADKNKSMAHGMKDSQGGEHKGHGHADQHAKKHQCDQSCEHHKNGHGGHHGDKGTENLNDLFN